MKQEFEDNVKNLNELVKSKSEIPKELFNLIVEQTRDKKTEILNQYKLIKFGSFFILHKIKLNDYVITRGQFFDLFYAVHHIGIGKSV